MLKKLLSIFTLIFSLFSTSAKSAGISTVSPDYCYAGKSLTIEITGLNTNFNINPQFTTVKFKLGNYTYVPQSVSVKSNTLISVVVLLPSHAAVGSYSLLVYDYADGNIAKADALYLYMPAIPSLSAVSPDSIKRGQYSAPITVTGINTNFNYQFQNLKIWLQKDSEIIHTVCSNNGLSRTNVITYPDVPASASPGLYDIYIQDSLDSIVIAKNAIFVLNNLAPAINIAAPDTLRLGKFVQLAVKCSNSHFDGKVKNSSKAALIMGNKDSLNADSIKVISQDSILCYFALSYTADTGFYSIYTTNSIDGTIRALNMVRIAYTLDIKLLSISPDNTKINSQSSFSLFATNTNFASGQAGTWLSRDTLTIFPLSTAITGSNTMSTVYLIPRNTEPGKWDVNVRDKKDGILTIKEGFTILPTDYPLLISVYPLIARRENLTKVHIKGLSTNFTSTSSFFISGHAHPNTYFKVDSVISPNEVWMHLDPDNTLPEGPYIFYYSTPSFSTLNYPEPFNITSGTGMKSLENDSAGCIIFPNPFKNNFSLKYNLDKTEEVSFEIRDVLGNTLYYSNMKIQKKGNHVWNFDSAADRFKPGLYIVRLMMGDNAMNFKVYKIEKY